ncbi:putative oxidoreductase DltE [Pseudocercospora fuligena]|uniref:Putative oxidoreductase DltE n=1 Tax=Pseudocercospora fuligena TaxID=685502 RepID=A0A8H6RJC0_9PEZI|nr:putative oxidoreductase DltE [Pseudocercospora fuligena]
MSSQFSIMKTILIIGGTSGIGESFARRFHAQGKTVIITGRRTERLEKLKSELGKGLETYAMDNNDLSALPKHIETLFKQYPNLDTVWVNSGIQYTSSIKDIDTSSEERIEQEVMTNVTSPMIIARHVVPKLLAQDFPTTFMMSGSGLGFVPMGIFPVYCATKAAVHSYMVGIRQTLQGSNVNVIEIVPPAVGTELDAPHKELTKKFPAPLTLDEFGNEVFGKLENGKVGEMKEVAAGTANPRVETWRGSIGKVLEERGIGG